MNKRNLTTICQFFIVELLMNYKTSSSLDHQREPTKTQVLNPFLSGLRDAQANIPNSGSFKSLR